MSATSQPYAPIVGSSSAPPTSAARPSSRLEVLPTRNPKVIFKALATGAVLYSTEEEVYFGLNPVGVRVWELLPPAHRHLDEICRVIASDYPDVPEDVIRADVTELLEELSKLGLVQPSETSAQRVS
jgi:hypothetical protein